MGKLIHNESKEFSSENAIDNVLRSIVSGNADICNQGTCLMINGIGVVCRYGIEAMIDQINYVQEIWGINYRKGRRIMHEVFLLNREEVSALGSVEVLKAFVYELGYSYFKKGHQVVYAVYDNGTAGMQIHFFISTVNFNSGYKLVWKTKDLYSRENCFNLILERYMHQAVRFAEK